MNKKQMLITALLDLLLLVGAFTAVLTIDGGRWTRQAIQNFEAQPSRWDVLALPDRNASSQFPDTETRSVIKTCRAPTAPAPTEKDFNARLLASYNTARGC